MIIVRLLSTRAFMVGFGTTKLTRVWEPALLWNQLTTRKFRLGLSLKSGGTPYVALRYADPLHPTRNRKNQGKPGAAGRCQEGCRESGRNDSRLVLDHGEVRRRDHLGISQ